MRITICVLATLVIACPIMPYATDRGTLEFGSDVTLRHISFDDVFSSSKTTVSAPDYLRVGIYLMPYLEIEPRVALAVNRTEWSKTTVIGTAMALSLNHCESGMSLFAEAIGTADFVMGGYSVTQFGAGLGVGLKGTGRIFAPRLEVAVIKRFEGSHSDASTTVQLSLGVSFFSK